MKKIKEDEEKYYQRKLNETSIIAENKIAYNKDRKVRKKFIFTTRKTFQERLD